VPVRAYTLRVINYGGGCGAAISAKASRKAAARYRSNNLRISVADAEYQQPYNQLIKKP
jgi:hypothetical protein